MEFRKICWKDICSVAQSFIFQLLIYYVILLLLTVELQFFLVYPLIPIIRLILKLRLLIFSHFFYTVVYLWLFCLRKAKLKFLSVVTFRFFCHSFPFNSFRFFFFNLVVCLECFCAHCYITLSLPFVRMLLIFF